jgi:hypothetical protein
VIVLAFVLPFAAMSAKSQKQKSILGFFHKKDSSPLQPQINGASQRPVMLPLSPKKKSVPRSTVGQTLTPAPSSDAVMDEDEDDVIVPSRKKRAPVGLPSPVTPATTTIKDASSVTMSNSPSRKVWMSLPCRTSSNPAC